MLTADKANPRRLRLARLPDRGAAVRSPCRARRGTCRRPAQGGGRLVGQPPRGPCRPTRCAQCGCTRRGRDVLARRDVLGRAAADRRVMAFPSPLDVGTVSIARPGRHRRPHSPHRPHSAARSAGPSRAAATPSLRSWKLACGWAYDTAAMHPSRYNGRARSNELQPWCASAVRLERASEPPRAALHAAAR